jgi:tRNA dimethylallyltransferase
VDEVWALLKSGVPEKCTAMQAIGYKEMAAALLGGGDVGAAAEEIKLRSRQYAKRQLTWFRRKEGAKWIFWGPSPDFEKARRLSTQYMEEFGL